MINEEEEEEEEGEEEENVMCYLFEISYLMDLIQNDVQTCLSLPSVAFLC